MKKKIIINGKIFTKKYISGVQRYTLEIINAIDKIVEKGKIEICTPMSATNIPEYKNIDIVKYSKLKGILWEQIAFAKYVKKNNGISINLGNVSPWVDPGIVCIHDINCMRNPRNFQKRMVLWYKFLFKRAIKKAKKIITVSEFSKKEMIDYYKIDEKRIAVVPNSWEHFEQIKEDNNVFVKYPELTEKEFFFSLGTLTKHKNLKWVLEVAKRNPQYLFAISGFVNIQKYKDQLDSDSPKNVIYLGYLTDGEVKAIYKKMKALLFPSVYEGFGLPPIEALSVEAKVVVSDIECMKEIFKKSVIYINPYDYEINLDSLLKNDISDVKEVLNEYNWQESARKLLKVIYEEVG